VVLEPAAVEFMPEGGGVADPGAGLLLLATLLGAEDEDGGSPLLVGGGGPCEVGGGGPPEDEGGGGPPG